MLASPRVRSMQLGFHFVSYVLRRRQRFNVSVLLVPKQSASLSFYITDTKALVLLRGSGYAPNEMLFGT